MKTFEFKVKIEMQWNAKQNEALQTLRRWLEHYGYTSTSFGFEFTEADTIKNKDL